MPSIHRAEPSLAGSDTRRVVLSRQRSNGGNLCLFLNPVKRSYPEFGVLPGTLQNLPMAMELNSYFTGSSCG